MPPTPNNKTPGICDHCGTIQNALTTWPQEIHHTCNCLCHKLRLDTLKQLANTKPKKKKTR